MKNLYFLRFYHYQYTQCIAAPFSFKLIPILKLITTFYGVRRNVIGKSYDRTFPMSQIEVLGNDELERMMLDTQGT